MEKDILKEPMTEPEKDPNYAEELIELFRGQLSEEELLERLNDYHENDIADAFTRVTSEERKKLYPILGPERMSEIFSYIEDVDEYIKELDVRHVAKIIENMDSDDAVDVLEEMDEPTQEIVTKLLDEETSADIQLIQSYEEDEIGSLMTTNFIVIHKNMTVKQAMRSLVSQAEKNDNISTLYVVDEEERYYGALDLKDLITARDYTELEPLMSTSYPYVNDHDLIADCIDRLVDYAEDSIPVLNVDHEIIGILTSQDIVEVVDEELSEDYAKLAGMISESDLKETLPESMKKRIPWLVILLCLGIAVSTVISMFEGVISRVALVVSFQSLILDMAGNGGTQSLAVTIRVLMDENLTPGQKVGLVWKEIRIGFCNGLLLGLMTFAFVGLYIGLAKEVTWSYAFSISGCVGISLLVAMMISAFVGTVVPMFFHKIKVDPAVASGPLITTVNDLVAVVTYYGLVWILLFQVMHIVS